MEQEKKKSGVVTLLIVVIIVLLTLVVLLATGTINFKDDNSINNCGEKTVTNNINDANSSSNIGQTDKENLYDNIEMDKGILDELYYIIGALPEDGEKINTPRHCLNVAITNTNYLGTLYAKDVFSWYVTTYKKQADYNKYKDANMYVDSNNVKVSAYNCAACFTIEKTEVENFKNLYYFGPEEKFEFIADNIENYDNIYSASHSLGSPVECYYNVKHNIINMETNKNIDGDTIYVADEQIVTRYDDVENGEISQLTKQTVIYSFYKKNASDAYKLSHVFHRNKI